MPKGQHIEMVAAKALLDLIALRSRPYSDEDIRSIVNVLTVAMELFVKDALYVNIVGNKEFGRLINGLATFGIGKAEIDALNKLRLLYNKTHHDVAISAALGEVVDVVCEALRAIEQIISLGISDTGADARPVMRRTFWIAGWFQDNGGDVETSVIVPDPMISFVWRPLDSIYLKLNAWDSIKADCSAIGRVRDGGKAIPTSVLKCFEQASDLVDCFEFDGDYRGLVRMLAAREDRQELSADLLRENNAHAMCHASAFAAVDCATAGVAISCADLEEAILKQAEMTYAAPARSSYLREYSARLAALVSAQPRGLQLTGPISLVPDTFDAFVNEGKAVGESGENSLFAISSDGALLLAAG